MATRTKVAKQLSIGFNQPFDLSIFEIVDSKVNLTKICKHFGKDINEWKRLPNTQRFLEGKEKTITIKGGKGKDQGTFTTDKQIATHLINWCQKKSNDKFLRLELEYRKLLEKTFEGITKIAPQFQVKNYRIDFYLPEYNIAIEYDEKHHSTATNMNRDLEREIIIKNVLGCQIVRVKQGQEIESLNTIFKLIIKK